MLQFPLTKFQGVVIPIIHMERIAYPRAIIKDNLNLIASIIRYLKPDVFCGQQQQPSEFLRPWKYPNRNNANLLNGWEPSLTHPGPFLQGQDARVLLNNSPGNQLP